MLLLNVVVETNRVPKIANSMESNLQASSPGRSVGGARKGRRACNGCQLNASSRVIFFFKCCFRVRIDTNSNPNPGPGPDPEPAFY